MLTTKAYDQFVTGQVSTDDVVVETATGRVVSRHTAEKRVMTSYAEHGTEERPVPEARRRQPVLNDAAAADPTVARGWGAPHPRGGYAVSRRARWRWGRGGS